MCVEETSGSEETGDSHEESHLALEEVRAALEVMNKMKEALQGRLHKRIRQTNG